MGRRDPARVGAAVLLARRRPATLRVARGRVTTFLIVGALFSAVPFTLIAVATVTLPAGFTSLLNAATPLFTAAIAVAFMGQRISCAGRRRAGRRRRRGHRAGRLVAARARRRRPSWPSRPASGAPASYAVAGNFARARLADVEPIELATGMVTAGALVALPVALLSGAPGHARARRRRSRSSRWASCRPRSPGRSSSGSSVARRRPRRAR